MLQFDNEQLRRNITRKEGESKKRKNYYKEEINLFIYLRVPITMKKPSIYRAYNLKSIELCQNIKTNTI